MWVLHQLRTTALRDIHTTMAGNAVQVLLTFLWKCPSPVRSTYSSPAGPCTPSWGRPSSRSCWWTWCAAARHRTASEEWQPVAAFASLCSDTHTHTSRKQQSQTPSSYSITWHRAIEYCRRGGWMDGDCVLCLIVNFHWNPIMHNLNWWVRLEGGRQLPVWDGKGLPSQNDARLYVFWPEHSPCRLNLATALVFKTCWAASFDIFEV